MTMHKFKFQLAIMKEMAASLKFIKQKEPDDDCVTGIGHELERERGRIEGYKRAIELYEAETEEEKQLNISNFENAQTKKFIKRFRQNVEYHIRSAESLYTEAPSFLLDKLSKQMMDEHAGYIGGLKVSLQLLNSIDEDLDEDEDDE